MYMAQLSVAPLRQEAYGLGSLEIDREHPHVIYSHANPMRNPVTDKSRPGYNINIRVRVWGWVWVMVEFGTSSAFRGWVRDLGYGFGVRGRKVMSRDCSLASDLVRAPG